MNFSHTVTIDASREKVVAIFSNPENRKHWHPGLEGIELIKGETGQVGAVTKMHFSGKQEFDLIETITVNDLPNEFSGEYETENTCWNRMTSYFREIGPNQTEYRTEIEYEFYMKFLKVMAFLMPWMFKKPVRKSLELFKAYVESQPRN